MSDIFVSYKRGDVEKVARLVAALRGAGHGTWWDQDIPPSAPWETTTEQALEEARVLIVCWTPAAVASEMVRAEARRARAQGKLIQVYLEPCEPPLFFGERQGLDFTGWSGDPAAPAFSRLVEGVRAVLENGASPDQTFDPSNEDRAGRRTEPPAPLSAGSIDPASRRASRRTRVAIAAGVALIVALAATWLLWPANAGIPTVAIVGQPQTGASDIAEGVASDLIRLAAVHAGDFRVTEGPDAADYQVRVALRVGRTPQADVKLVERRSGEPLWSATFDVPEGDQIGSLRPAIAAKLSEMFLCALGPRGLQALSSTDGRLFLVACDAAEQSGSQVGISALEQLTGRNPDFAQGWVALADAETLAAYGTGPPVAERDARRLSANARAHLERARSLDPGLAGQTYLVESRLLPPGRWLEQLALIDRGIGVDPDYPALHLERAHVLARLGRLNEGSDSLKRAAQLDPLSPGPDLEYALTLLDMGATELGLKELERAEQLWPNLAVTREARFYYEMRYGAGPRALELFEAGKTTFSATHPYGPLPLLRALADRNPHNVSAAVQWLCVGALKDIGSVPLRVQALAQLGYPEKIPQVLAPPGAIDRLRQSTEVLFLEHVRSLRADPGFIRLATRLGLVAAWEKSGVWPDFCADVRLRYDCRAEAKRMASEPLERS